MPVVLDASLAFALAAGEASPFDLTGIADLVAERGAVAPRHWALEMANALSMSCRRGRMTVEQRRTAANALESFDVAIDMLEIDVFGTLIDLADRHRLTAYDAAYLELAMRTGYPLASLDGDLRAAAKKEKVALIPV